MIMNEPEVFNENLVRFIPVSAGYVFRWVTRKLTYHNVFGALTSSGVSIDLAGNVQLDPNRVNYHEITHALEIGNVFNTVNPHKVITGIIHSMKLCTHDERCKNTAIAIEREYDPYEFTVVGVMPRLITDHNCVSFAKLNNENRKASILKDMTPNNLFELDIVNAAKFLCGFHFAQPDAQFLELWDDGVTYWCVMVQGAWQTLRVD